MNETPTGTWTAVWYRYQVRHETACGSVSDAIDLLREGSEQNMLAAVEVIGPDGYRYKLSSDHRECARVGCGRSIAGGFALHRISPKGEPFVGVCSVHHAGEVDPVVTAIEERNLGFRERRL
jgi:hypothetical protein